MLELQVSRVDPHQEVGVTVSTLRQVDPRDQWILRAGSIMRRCDQLDRPVTIRRRVKKRDSTVRPQSSRRVVEELVSVVSRANRSSGTKTLRDIGSGARQIRSDPAEEETLSVDRGQRTSTAIPSIVMLEMLSLCLGFPVQTRGGRLLPTEPHRLEC